MNIAVEVRPGEGGQDAETFAEELVQAISRSLTKAGIASSLDGNTVNVKVVPVWL